MSGSEVEDAWVARVLGIEVAAAAPGRRRPATPIWNDAKEAVDRALNGLCAAARDFDHPLTRQVVDKGLPGITGRLIAPLTAALMSYDAAPSTQQATTLLPKLQAMRGFLASDRVVALVEDNPFGVAVAIRDPLLHALAEIEQTLGV